MTTVPPVTTAQRSIRERVQALGPAVQRLRRPAVLAGAALWPVAAPLLGTGAAVGVTGGLMGLLGGPGQQFITDFLERARGRRERDVRAAFDRALLERLEEGGEMASALREDIGRLLRQVDGVEVALAATREDTRDALARGLAELGEMWSEFGFMLSQVRAALADVQARQVEALAVQRSQLDLQREQLVKTNLLLRRGEQQPARKRPPRRPARRAPAADVAPPFKGLQAFEPEDAELFFGRERLIAELLARLAESRMLAIVGDSGSGKPSLLRAGVVRAVWDGALPGSSAWRVAVFTPGETPLEELAVRVAALCGTVAGRLAADLRDDPTALAPAARPALLDAPEGARLLLAVDQLEELFAMGADAAAVRAFLQSLLVVAARPSGAVVVAIRIVPQHGQYGRIGRSDRCDRCCHGPHREGIDARFAASRT